MPIACAVFTFLRPHRHQITDHLIRSKKWDAATASLKTPRTLYNGWLIFWFLWLHSHKYVPIYMTLWNRAMWTLQSLTGKLQGRITTQGDPCSHYKEWVYRVQLSLVLVTFLSLFYKHCNCCSCSFNVYRKLPIHTTGFEGLL